MTTKKISILVVLILALSIFIWAAWQQALSNQNMIDVDQYSYMQYGKRLWESNFTLVWERNRMPLYPSLQALFNYRTGTPDELFFERGKITNILLTAFTLFGLLAIVSRWLPKWSSINLVLVYTFSVAIYYAGFFQVEMLFYFTNFVAFVMMLMTIHKPTYQRGIATGLILGIGHLLKASVLPALLLFVVVGGLRTFWADKENNQQKQSATAVLLTILTFFLITGVYLHNSKQVYGHYFYNVNSTFYMWYDTWNDARLGTYAHGDADGWPDMPPEEIPSFSKYLEEHTWQEIGRRQLTGLYYVIQVARVDANFFKYVILYLGFAVMLLMVNGRYTLQLIKQHPFIWLFILGYFGGYLILYGWYMAMFPVARFMLAQYIPLLFTLLMFTLQYKPHMQKTNQPVQLFTLFQLLISLVVLWDIGSVLAYW